MRWSRLFYPLFGAGETLIDRILCVAGAVTFSQLPEFMQQYLQRLGGHLDEARRRLDQLMDIARQSGLTFDQLVTKASNNIDPAIARLGPVIRDAAARVETLKASEQAIRESSLASRPFVFLQHLDPEIARAAGSVFKPAVPTTVEGVVYALVGVITLLALYHGLVRQPIRHAWLRRRLAKSPTAPAR